MDEYSKPIAKEENLNHLGKLISGEISTELVDLDAKWEEEAKDSHYLVKRAFYNKFFNDRSYLTGFLDRVFLGKNKNITDNFLKDTMFYLFSLGYSSRTVLYVLYTIGYRHLDFESVKKFKERKKIEIELERRKLMERLKNTKEEVFQDMKDDVMEKEKAYLKVLLSQQQELVDKLSSLSPIKDGTEWSSVNAKIKAINKELKEMHGIDSYRKAVVDAHKEIYIEQNKKSGQKIYALGSPSRGDLPEEMSQLQEQVKEKAGGHFIE